MLDCETSGLSASNDRVISLAVIILDQGLNVIETWSTLINSGVDPGPVEVHGITQDMLRDAPSFEDIFTKLNSLLEGRVMVAHNASFDHNFLKAEAERLGLTLGHQGVLCTLRAARRMKLPLEKLTLGVLAKHYNITQTRAHDALDDTTVLVEIWKEFHAQAERDNIELYLQGEKTPSGFVRRSSKTPCPYLNPGKYSQGAQLVQGMRVAFTGGDEALRESLEKTTTQLGLDVSGSVSSKTSLLVSDGYSGSKSLKAISLGCPVITFEAYQQLLSEEILAGLTA